MTIAEIAEIVKGFSPLIISIAALYITWRYNLKNKELANDRMMKEIFLECNARYDSLNDIINLVLSLETDEEIEKFNKLNDEDNIKGVAKSLILYKINDYFNLCAEEYYWKQKGRIDETIWFSWHRGMIDIYNKSIIIRDLWEKECAHNGYESYYINKPNAFFSLTH